MQTQRRELNFEGQNVFIEIDVHLKSWTVSIFTEKLFHKTFNQPPGGVVLRNYLDRNFPNATYHSVYEAGFSGFWAHYKLKEMGINNIVINAADVPTSQKEKLHKDDKVDSQKLARSLRNGELRAIYVPETATQQERSLVRCRATLVKDMTRFKMRIKSFLYFYGINYPPQFEDSSKHWSRRFMMWLKEDIKLSHPEGQQALNLLIRQAEEQRTLLLDTTQKVRDLSQTEKYAHNMQLLRTIPGIGLITAITLLTEVADISRFESQDHLAGFIGIIPGRHSSGEKDKKTEMTFRGHYFLKRSLIESSWIAARLDPALNMAYHKYVQRMDPNKAIIRIARKITNRIYFVLTQQKEYVKGTV
jgi:transposase